MIHTHNKAALRDFKQPKKIPDVLHTIGGLALASAVVAVHELESCVDQRCQLLGRQRLPEEGLLPVGVERSASSAGSKVITHADHYDEALEQALNYLAATLSSRVSAACTCLLFHSTSIFTGGLCCLCERVGSTENFLHTRRMARGGGAVAVRILKNVPVASMPDARGAHGRLSRPLQLAAALLTPPSGSARCRGGCC